MENRKEIQLSVRNLVVKMRSENKSYGGIGKILKPSRSIVQTIIRNYEGTNSTENKPRSGRLRKLSRRDVSSILKEVNQEPKINAPKLAEYLERHSSVNVTPRTIINVLHDNGFRSRTASKKPLISEKKSSTSP